MITKEPAIVIAAIGTVAKAVVPVLIFGTIVHWDEKMTAAVMFLIDVVVASAATVFIRSQTVTNETADQQIVAAKDLPVSTTPNEAIKLVKESLAA